MPKAQRSLFKGKGPAKSSDGGGGGGTSGDASTRGGDGVGTQAEYLRSLTRWERQHLSPRKIDRLLDMDVNDGSEEDEYLYVGDSDADKSEEYQPTEVEFDIPIEPGSSEGETESDSDDDDAPTSRGRGIRPRARRPTMRRPRGRGRASGRGDGDGDGDSDSDGDDEPASIDAPSTSSGRGNRPRARSTSIRRSRGRSRGRGGQSRGRGVGGCPPRRRGGPGTGEEASEGGDEGEEEEEEGWSTSRDPPTVLPFTASPGMTVPTPTTPLGFIQLFLTLDLLRYIVEETNDYANYLRDELKQKSAYHWLGCGVMDIAQYLGLRIFMGICHLPVEHMYWRAGSAYAPPCFAQTMTFIRFKELSKYLHFHNRRALPRNYKDKLLPVKTVMEYVQNKCRSLYVPQRHLSLDEGMLPFKGRLSMKVYNPAKPDKYGIKFYILCEATSGFVLDFSMYSGVSRTLREIVFPLCQQYFHQGYHVYMDNYYNSVSLTNELYSMGTHSSGTLRLARGAPRALKVLAGSKQPRDSLNFRRKGNTFILCWQDVRLVSLITNIMGVETEEYRHHKRIRKGGITELEVTHLQRPLAIKEYIKHMRGVDRFDQKIKYYSFTRKTFKWTKKVLLYLVQMMLQNAHVLYLKYSTDQHKMSLLQFHEVAYDALINFNAADWPSGGTAIPHAADLPEDERHDRPHHPAAATSATPAATSATPAATSATPAAATSATPAAAATSATPATPATSATPAAAATSATPAAAATSATPAAATSATPAAATSATPAAAPADSPASKRPRLVDTPARLQAGRTMHTPEQFGGRRQLKRCRVCYMSGVRRETSYQCSTCKIPLCIRGDCFQRYHSLRKFWRSPADAARGSQQQ